MTSNDSTAHAKKSSKGSAKTLTKDWSELEPKLKVLMGKVQTHTLFTPEDGQSLEDLAQASQGLQEKYAKVAEFAPMLYNMAVLFKAREMYFESYDAFQTVITNYGTSPYARKAQFQMMGLKKVMGADFDMMQASQPATTPTTAPAKK